MNEAVQPYSGDHHTLPARNRHHEGVAASIDDYARKHGPITRLDTYDEPYYNIREHRGWTRLTLWAEFFDGTRAALYGCDEGDHCDLADAAAFRASIKEGTT